MIVIELCFAAGRFHATPWGRHVNEGVPEWPPSTYRLIRAIYDAWRRKRPDWPTDRIEPILAALSSAAPQFYLPPATAAHTRSFLSENTKNPTDRQLVFDSFVVLQPHDRVLIGWPDVVLDDSRYADLDELLSLLNYFGRSESWVIAKMVQKDTSETWNCIPADNRHRSDDLEPVSVACPIPLETYQATPYLRPGPARKGRGKAKAGYQPEPLPWLDALAWSTDDLLTSRRSDPPALQRVSYLRSQSCFDIVVQSHVRGTDRLIHGVLYALDSRQLPSILTTLEVAERFRRKLMGIHKYIVGDPARVAQKFSGKDAAGRPLTGHHHLYLLPLDRDGDGRIDHMIAACRQPLDHDEQIALDRLDSLWQLKGKPDIRFTPIRWGRLEDLFPAATRLRSATPFVPPRNHRRGRGTFSQWLARELAREASNHGLPIPRRVVEMPILSQADGRHVRWIQFRRNRKGADVRMGFGFALEFDVPVVGPFAIGYGAHFGLGQFVPVEE